MKKTLAAIVGVAFLGGGITALTAGSGNVDSAPLRPTRVVQSSGNDVSAPLSSLAGHPIENKLEKEKREAQDAQRRAAAGETATIGNAKPKKQKRKPQRTAPQTSDPLVQRQSAATRAASPSMPAPLNSFAGISSTQSNCGCYPPDTNAEVGPNHIVETVNVAIAVYSKTGVIAPTFPKPINALWSGFNAGPARRDNNDGDPVVMYDGLADRWVITQFAIPGFKSGAAGLNYECIAVSATSDPAGAYNRYQFAYAAGLLNDYPKFGVWPDAYYATYNNFTSPAGNWAGPSTAAYDRAKMIAGLPATAVQFNIAIGTNEGSLLPADLDGTALPPAGAPNPIVQMQDSTFGFAQDQIMIRRFHVDFATPANSTLSAPTVLATTAFNNDLCGFALCVPQQGTAQTLDALSDRIMFRASYRNLGSRDSLLINNTVDATGGDIAGIRWAEVRGATGVSPTIRQQSTYSPDNTHRWMGSIAQDRDGNIAMGYSASSTTLSPSLRYAGRLSADPLNQMTQGEATLFAGSGSQTGAAGRWGDYSSLSLDPSDDCTFWYANEYYSATGGLSWKTRIGSFKFPSCGAAAQPTIVVNDASVVEGNSGTKTVSVTFTLSQASATAVTFNYATANGTATAGSDYAAKSIAKTFNAGQTSITTTLTINGDTAVEANETFFLNLTNPLGATIADNQGKVTITNND